jgi:acyl dehydratase
VGQHIAQPYEVTVTEGWLAIWHSCFFQHDRLYTSTPFAEKMNLKQQVIPFSMMLFQTVSMSHVDESLEVMDLGYADAIYVRPVYPGDTLKKNFYIKGLRSSRKQSQSTVVTLRCEAYNQRNQLCFSCDKIMLYPYPVSALHQSKEPASRPAVQKSHLLEHLKSHVANSPVPVTLVPVLAGQLILHTYSRPTGLLLSTAINTLFKQAHPLLMNLGRFTEQELVLSGGTVMAQTISAASRELFEVLYEELVSCRFLNRVAPNETIGAMSYIQSVEPLSGGLEELTVVTLGLRETDVMTELKNVDVPEKLFTQTWATRSDLEEYILTHCPFFVGKVAVVATRKIIRQAPNANLNIPLL